MEPSKLTAPLSEEQRKKVLQTAPFGQTNVPSLWVEKSAFCEITKSVSVGTELENITLVQLGDAFVLSCFLTKEGVFSHVVRCSSEVPSSFEEEIELPSLRELFECAIGYEEEIANLFGAKFFDTHNKTVQKPQFAGKAWRGFPLRKSFVLAAQAILPEGP